MTSPDWHLSRASQGSPKGLFIEPSPDEPALTNQSWASAGVESRKTRQSAGILMARAHSKPLADDGASCHARLANELRDCHATMSDRAAGVTGVGLASRGESARDRDHPRRPAVQLRS